MLTIYQKSLYLIILNATMITRSIGKTLKNRNSRKTLKHYKKRLFKKLIFLSKKLEHGTLTEDAIIRAIEDLANEFSISFGQSQKAINVILKYHYYLNNLENQSIKNILHCPLDSKIIKKLNKKRISLTKIDKREYLSLQEKISKISKCKVCFDDHWDKQHLQDEGLL